MKVNKAEKELADMKNFVTSAGCMTIEHISTAIRHVRNAITQTEVRMELERVKHYADIMLEDFNLNFPKGKDNGSSDT